MYRGLFCFCFCFPHISGFSLCVPCAVSIVLVAALARCEENLAKAKAELRDCRMLSSTKYSQELVADNSRLREQSLCMRGVDREGERVLLP